MEAECSVGLDRQFAGAIDKQSSRVLIAYTSCPRGIIKALPQGVGHLGGRNSGTTAGGKRTIDIHGLSVAVSVARAVQGQRKRGERVIVNRKPCTTHYLALGVIHNKAHVIAIVLFGIHHF